jgi:N-methylhydantoinase A/acetophenone carboxylase
VTGPAIVEMEYSTIVVPPGQELRIDQHGLGILEDAGKDDPS